MRLLQLDFRPSQSYLHEKNCTFIGMAIANYVDATGHLPHDVGRLSWRVEVLKYWGTEELSLYKKFHLDEPWDSPHNKPLIAEIKATDGYRTDSNCGDPTSRLPYRD